MIRMESKRHPKLRIAVGSRIEVLENELCVVKYANTLVRPLCLSNDEMVVLIV